MKAAELREKFIKFFLLKKHQQIPSVSLVPENDPTVLFTTAGMHPLVPYLMGQPHPLGRRLCSVQKCLRTDDIEEVGDLRHFTFFEMLGNWSLGDYFKKEAIEWSFEFLTDKKWLGFNPQKIYISVFEGDKDAPQDKESIKIWQEVFLKVGIKARVGERIYTYGKKENWWGPAGETGPCGPDTEMFYDTGLPHNKKFGEFCHPNCNCGRYVEIWNDVFMEFNKRIKNKGEYEFIQLKQKNVDTGLGLERGVALTEFIGGKIEKPDPFQTELFTTIIYIIEVGSKKLYCDYPREFRIIADHLRASVFLIADGVEPSNKERGYVLRRLIRRAVRYGNLIGLKQFTDRLAKEIINIYGKTYPELKSNREKIVSLLVAEEEKFQKTLSFGLKVLNKELNGVKEKKSKWLSGKVTFDLYQTYGFPPELISEELRRLKLDIKINQEEFSDKLSKHQQLSREGAKHKFAGGLADHSEQTTKLHTATHLLHAALRKILGDQVHQVGSNITAERLRFDFTHPDKLTAEQLKQIEDLVNEQIKKNLRVECQVMSLIEAEKQGALAFFDQKYPEQVKVYTIGGPSTRLRRAQPRSGQAFSLEVCAGPHSDFTGTLGTFKIVKEEAVGTGKRRLYAQLR